MGLRCIQQICQKTPTTACASREDCPLGQVCRHGRCVLGSQPRPGADPGPGPEPAGPGWADFKLGGTHFFGGIILAPAMTGFWNYGGPVEVEAAFFFAFRLGVLFDRTELSLELSPAAWIWDFEPKRNSLTFLANIGALVKVSDRAYWPLRFGLGLTSGELPFDKVYMEGRVDLVGLAFQYGHLLFEVNLPSTRFHTEFKEVGIWAWLFNISVSYLI